MLFLAETSTDGVREQLFSTHDIPAVLWSPDGARGARPLVLLSHGGGRHKKDPEMVELGRRLALDHGYAVVVPDVPAHGDRPPVEEYQRLADRNQSRVAAGEDLGPLIAAFQALVARQTVPEWRAVLDAVQQLPHVGAGPVGYWGVSLGCGLGVPFVAAEPRVRAAVLGLGGASANADLAARITAPVQFVLQWDDERVPRAHGLALYDAIGSAEKTLHANPGGHEMPPAEVDSAVRFLARHLG
ncbi:dienelactone hydrolase family protein [Actinoplanes sp. KI2]|uniref:dienelactone hydrolase family protein n=1 Tax=Actinoplanes sp. KI2 TaxID=2983315 RepID=UPI0021D5A513|nr:dienelactone hydrolase family protein [Actinoplanes sp. KI2]MCU7727981.1 dienelactone hydrolase family protein [Actinoplanes sp. KI2]